MDEAFPVSPPPAIAYPDSSPSLLSCVPHAVAVRVALSPPPPPAFNATSSVADFSVSMLLHLALLSALSSWPSSPRGTPPLPRRYIPAHGEFPGPVLRAPVPPSSSLRPFSSSLPPTLRSAALLCSHFSFLIRRPPPPRRTSGYCGRLPCPARPFPRPKPPI